MSDNIDRLPYEKNALRVVALMLIVFLGAGTNLFVWNLVSHWLTEPNTTLNIVATVVAVFMFVVDIFLLMAIGVGIYQILNNSKGAE